MPKDLKFNAPPGHTLEVNGEVVHGGGVAKKVPDDVADELLTAPYVDVSEVKRGRESRADVNARAIAAGVKHPEKLSNIPAVEAAIEEAQQAAADAGEGPETTTQED